MGVLSWDVWSREIHRGRRKTSLVWGVGGKWGWGGPTKIDKRLNCCPKWSLSIVCVWVCFHRCRPPEQFTGLPWSILVTNRAKLALTVFQAHLFQRWTSCKQLKKTKEKNKLCLRLLDFTRSPPRPPAVQSPWPCVFHQERNVSSANHSNCRRAIASCGENEGGFRGGEVGVGVGVVISEPAAVTTETYWLLSFVSSISVEANLARRGYECAHRADTQRAWPVIISLHFLSSLQSSCLGEGSRVISTVQDQHPGTRTGEICRKPRPEW